MAGREYASCAFVRQGCREYNPEDAVRFYVLRLREAGTIKSSPNKILADGTDWHHWNELKRELRS